MHLSLLFYILVCLLAHIYLLFFCLFCMFFCIFPFVICIFLQNFLGCFLWCSTVSVHMQFVVNRSFNNVLCNSQVAGLARTASMQQLCPLVTGGSSRHSRPCFKLYKLWMHSYHLGSLFCTANAREVPPGKYILCILCIFCILDEKFQRSLFAGWRFWIKEHRDLNVQHAKIAKPLPSRYSWNCLHRGWKYTITSSGKCILHFSMFLF